MRTLLLLSLILVVLMALVVFRSGRLTIPESSESTQIGIGDLELVPESVSTERAGELLPLEGSEDASHILQVPAINASTEDGRWESDSYPPSPEVDWIVDVRLPQGQTLTGDEVLSVFDVEWRREIGGAMLYGFCPHLDVWTFIGAKDAPEPYSIVAVAKSLSMSDGITAGELGRLLQLTASRAYRWDGSSVEPRESPSEGAIRAARFSELKRSLSQDAVIVLRSPGLPFDGKEIWDVMYSLGLSWGDMDLFNWANPYDVGDSYFFSVWTSTPPGYFLPEEISAGRLHVDDLVFGYSIPRCADPLKVHGVMLEAARYAQSRLGGRLVGYHGQPLDADRELRFITSVVDALNEAGLRPGADSTLRIF